MSDPMFLDSVEVAGMLDEIEQLRKELAERDATIAALETTIATLEMKVITQQCTALAIMDERDQARTAVFERDATIAQVTGQRDTALSTLRERRYEIDAATAIIAERDATIAQWHRWAAEMVSWIDAAMVSVSDTGSWMSPSSLPLIKAALAEQPSTGES